MMTMSSPTSVRTSRKAVLSTPSGSIPAEPVASRVAGTPNSMIPPSPAATASTAALRSESRVCCTTPGMDGIGTGSVAPSLTNTGNTSCLAVTVVSRTNPRIAAVARNLRGRLLGYIAVPSDAVLRTDRSLDADCGFQAPDYPSLHPDCGRKRAGLAAPRFGFAGWGQGAGGAQLRSVGGEGVHQRADLGDLGLDVNPEAELDGGLRGCRADTGHDRAGMRFAGDTDQVAHRGRGGEAHRVEATRLDHLAGFGRWWCSPHRPVGRHVIDLPDAVTQPRGQRLGGDVRARQQ